MSVHRTIGPLVFSCNCVVSFRRRFLFLWVLGMGCVILLWHCLGLQYNHVGKTQIGLLMLHILALGERSGLVVNASDSGSRGRGFEPHSGQTVLRP